MLCVHNEQIITFINETFISIHGAYIGHILKHKTLSKLPHEYSIKFNHYYASLTGIRFCIYIIYHTFVDINILLALAIYFKLDFVSKQTLNHFV